MKVMTVLLHITLVILIWVCAKPEIYGQRTGAIAVGEVAPDFTLADQNGQKVTLTASV